MGLFAEPRSVVRGISRKPPALFTPLRPKASPRPPPPSSPACLELSHLSLPSTARPVSIIPHLARLGPCPVPGWPNRSLKSQPERRARRDRKRIEHWVETPRMGRPGRPQPIESARTVTIKWPAGLRRTAPCKGTFFHLAPKNFVAPWRPQNRAGQTASPGASNAFSALPEHPFFSPHLSGFEPATCGKVRATRLRANADALKPPNV